MIAKSGQSANSKKPARQGRRSKQEQHDGLWEPSGRTDAANARRLIALHGRNLRWCDQWGKWLVWDGTRWTIDQQCAAESLAKDAAGRLWLNVAAATNMVEEKLHAEMVRFAKASNQANGVRNALALARSEPDTPILTDALDRDPWLLNVVNGTLDLRTGNLRPHDRADLITKLAPVVYDPHAECPTWRAFLDRVLDGDREIERFICRLVGYCLTGSTQEHVLPFLYGKGSNGKSALLNTILSLMGEEYGMKAPPDLLMAKKGQSHPTERADLFGKRFVAAIEAEDGRRLAEALVKELSGGDKVRARRMREDFWEFEPTHKIWLAANHKPTIRGTDHGIWRRVKLIPFTVTTPDKEQDKRFPEKLKAELSGILNWALSGCMEWQAEGLGEPAVVQHATDAYRSEMDVLGEFLGECCIIDESAKAGATPLYEAFVGWCERTGETAINQRQFGERLTERGYGIGRDGRGRKVRLGVGLLQGDTP